LNINGLLLLQLADRNDGPRQLTFLHNLFRAWTKIALIFSGRALALLDKKNKGRKNNSHEYACQEINKSGK